MWRKTGTAADADAADAAGAGCEWCVYSDRLAALIRSNLPSRINHTYDATRWESNDHLQHLHNNDWWAPDEEAEPPRMGGMRHDALY